MIIVPRDGDDVLVRLLDRLEEAFSDELRPAALTGEIVPYDIAA